MYERLGRKKLLVLFFYTEYFVRHYTLRICGSTVLSVFVKQHL
jgi:hypothetical protein